MIRPLITTRLVLRKLKESDAQRIFELRSNPSVNKYLDRIACTHLDEADHFIGMITENVEKNDCYYWAITLEDKLIGTICLWNFIKEKNKTEIGFELLPEFQGKGLMHEAVKAVIDFAFNVLKLDAIEGFTDPLNTASIMLMKKMGFVLVENEEGKMSVFRLERRKG